MFVFKTIIWGTIFSFAALIAGPWIAVQFDLSFPPLSLGAFRYFGIVLMIFAIPFALYCSYLLFVPGTQRPVPYDAEGSFTIAGPYKYVRNPFLLGVIVTLIGEAIFMSRFAMLAYAIIFTWCVHFWVIFFEEPALLERFQNEYRDYMKKVPRWIPKFKGYS